MELRGQLGFVDVSLAGDRTVSPDGKAFQIAKKDSALPMFALDIMGGDLSYSSLTIPKAISVTAFVSDTLRYLRPTCNVKVTGGLKATAKLGGATPEMNGGIRLDWPNVFDDQCLPNFDTLQVTPETDFSTNLMNLDLSPSLYGKYTPGVNSTSSITSTLIDSRANFGQGDRKLAGAVLKNLTTGAQCVITEVKGPHQVKCESGLEGGLRKWSGSYDTEQEKRDREKREGNEWKAGDKIRNRGGSAGHVGTDPRRAKRTGWKAGWAEPARFL